MTDRITKVRQDGVHQMVFLFVSIKNNVRSTILMFRNGESMGIWYFHQHPLNRHTLTT